MVSFISLTRAENFKLWKRLSTRIMPLILIAAVIGLCGLMKMSFSISSAAGTASGEKPVPGGWKTALKIENSSLETSIKAAQKSKEQSVKNAIGSQKMQLAENKYYLSHNLKPYNRNDDGTSSSRARSDFWSLVLEFGMSSLTALMAIIACSGLTAGEFSDGTMKTMISRPFSRWQILTAKLLAVLGYSFVLTAVSYVAVLGSVAAFFGTAGAGRTVLLWMNGGVVPMTGLAASLLCTLMDLLSTLVYVLLAFGLSAVFRSRALATGLSIFLMFGGSFTTLLAYHFSWGKFIFFADTSFSAFLSGGPPFYGITLSLALFICGLYCVAFLAAAYLTFLKRDIAG